MIRNRFRKACTKSRRAAVLIAALTCLAIVMALVGGMLLAALRNVHQLRAERELRQCELLLAAGTARAMRQAEIASDYDGEVWSLSTSEISNSGEGEVRIQAVSDSSDQPRQFRVVAEYPLGGPTSIRRTQTIFVPITRPARQE